MMASRSVFLPGSEATLSRYLHKIGKFPMLAREEEYVLAKRWREHQDSAAAQKLATSHLRLVAKLAIGYRGYGLPLSDLMSEGNVGMMQAINRFDPERGFRCATYAAFWIRAAIHQYSLRSRSLAKMGTTASQEEAGFQSASAEGPAAGDRWRAPGHVKTIAHELDVRRPMLSV
jgi:RNA polymerase sigma-32 factor